MKNLLNKSRLIKHVAADILKYSATGHKNFQILGYKTIDGIVIIGLGTIFTKDEVDDLSHWMWENFPEVTGYYDPSQYSAINMLVLL